MSSVPSINPGYPSDRPQIVGRIGQPKISGSPSDAPSTMSNDKSDTVELSSEALAAAGNPDTARAERLAKIKAQIQAGTYDEDAKLTFVADRLAKLFGNG